MVMRAEREHLAIGIEFDVATEDIANGTISDEICNSVGACQIGLGVIDDEASGQEEITGEE